MGVQCLSFVSLLIGVFSRDCRGQAKLTCSCTLTRRPWIRTEFIKELMLGQSTAGAGREFHNVAELTNKEL